jgi:hypothetical protein
MIHFYEYLFSILAVRQYHDNICTDPLILFGLSGYAQIGNSSTTVEELFNDTERLSYIRDYLTYLSFAIR